MNYKFNMKGGNLNWQAVLIFSEPIELADTRTTNRQAGTGLSEETELMFNVDDCTTEEYVEPADI